MVIYSIGGVEIIMKKLVAGLVASVLLAGAANAAVTVSSTAYGFDTSFADGLGKASFDGGSINTATTGLALSGSGYTIHAGGSAANDGNGAAPAISTTAYDSTSYLAVQNGSAIVSSSTTGTLYNTLTFYWGSIDTYNSLDLLDANGNSILGGTLINTANYGSSLGVGSGDQTSGATNRMVTIYSTTAFSKVSFNSTSAAFELDNVKLSTSAVPEPATWGMMILGFGAVGFAMRRRQATVAQTMIG